MSVEFLKRDGFPALAYLRTKGENPSLPTVVFLSGFRSDMMGTKAEYLAQACARRGQEFVRFDYSGHGQSGGAFTDGTIGSWLEDALAVIDMLTDGRLIVVGSSMGGWLALRAALLRKDRVKGLIGLAAAPDFTRGIPAAMTQAQKDELESKGYFTEANEYDSDYIFTKTLLEEGEAHCMLDGPIAIDCPVRLVQGMKDDDVPWQTAHRIANALTTQDKKVYLREEGTHRLSSGDDLALLERLVAELSG
jgi:pimeloyl-ACP methyl ester carboxylesterase